MLCSLLAVGSATEVHFLLEWWECQGHRVILKLEAVKEGIGRGHLDDRCNSLAIAIVFSSSRYVLKICSRSFVHRVCR